MLRKRSICQFNVGVFCKVLPDKFSERTCPLKWPYIVGTARDRRTCNATLKSPKCLNCGSIG